MMRQCCRQMARCSLLLLSVVVLGSVWMVVGFNSNFVGVERRFPTIIRKNCNKERVWHATTMESSDGDVLLKSKGMMMTMTEETSPLEEVSKHYDALITGAGPAGLLTAIMLSQRYGPDYKLAICEKRSTIPPKPTDAEVWSDVARFYLLGIGFRGQNAMRKFGVYPDFESASVPVHGRRDWQPGMGHTDGQVTLSNKSVTSRILARDKLVAVLHHHFMDNYVTKNPNIDILYGYQVDLLMDQNDIIQEGKSTDNRVQLQISSCQEQTTSPQTTTNDKANDSNGQYVASQDVGEELCDVDTARIVTSSLVIGADGSARTIANAMEEYDAKIQKAISNPFRRLLYKPFKVTRYKDDNPRFFKSIPIQIPRDWPQNLNYSARSTDGSRITLEALPSDDNGNLCALILMKPDDDFCQANVDVSTLRAFFDEEFPQFSKLISDDVMESVAAKPPSPLPSFRYAGPKLHLGDRTMILGDSAHTVKPYYGLGANSAMEDVVILSDCLDETNDDIPQALKLFTDKRASDSEALVTMSRNMDRPGKMFFFGFLLPLILDGIFHKALPKVFGPNMFQMFQRQDIGFTQIRKKKRLDRLMQISLLFAFFSGLTKTTIATIGFISRLTGKSKSLVSGGTVALLAFSAMWKNTLKNKEMIKEKQTASS